MLDMKNFPPSPAGIRQRGFSQCQDWVRPGGHKKGRAEDGGWDEAHIGNFDEFLAEISVPQV